MKLFFLVLTLYFYLTINAFGEIEVSDFKNYEITKTKFQLETISENLKYPWGMTFIDDETLLITEKKGSLYKININTKLKEIVDHDLKIMAVRQGGLLDVLYHNDYVYFSYSHAEDSKSSSTAIARGKLINNSIQDLEVIFISKPKIKYSDVHFGSRLAIKDNYLFASIGERGKGMIAQDPTQHPGSIIRINLDGSIPEDNPKFINQPNWLAEIYQIGIRNPQGMALSPYDNQIYISNHGPMGGDFIGIVHHSGNYGWKEIGWGGKNYDGSKIGEGKPFEEKFDKPLISWVPSIAPSNIQFYNKNMFEDLKGKLIITSLKYNMLLKLEIKNNKVIDKEIILRGCRAHKKPCYNIGRIRDIETGQDGSIYIITDEKKSSLIKISK